MDELIFLAFFIFGSVLGVLLLWKIFHVVKSSIYKDKTPITEEDYDRLARAFVQHKKEMQERVQNLEAIVAENEDEKLDFSQLEDNHTDGSLTNDLKDKQRSR